MKAIATISLNEDCSFDRARALTRMIRNQMGRLLKTKEIKGLGNIEKTANSMTHIHLLLEMTHAQFEVQSLLHGRWRCRSSPIHHTVRTGKREKKR